MALELTIVGASLDNAYRDYLLSRIQGKKVKLLEGLTDSAVLDLLQTAGIFVDAATYVNYLGGTHPQPELLGLAPLAALSTGLPTLVSDAGALPELTCVPGCYIFQSVSDLNRLLHSHLEGQLPRFDPQTMAASVAEQYGQEGFGRKMLTELQEYLR